MKLTNFSIKNYRSIVDSGNIRIETIQSFVGENNVGKSNILYALQIFLTSGAGGTKESDFFNPEEPIIITATFSNLTQIERKKLRIYLLGDKLILEKRVLLLLDGRSGKLKANAEYHGYISKPNDWWLSTESVIEHEGTNRPNWEKIAIDHSIIDYVKENDGRVNKKSYESGIQRFIIENENVEFEEPELGQTQALGLQPVLLETLPSFYLLPAITDYSDEISRQSTNTNFRRLMGDLADRILKFDPRFQEIEKSIKTLTSLLNVPETEEVIDESHKRLPILDDVEDKLKNLLSKLMPSVCGVRIKVTIEGIKNIFAQGVSILIDDGKLSEVLTKGHGLQRCVVFSLLQALILNQQGKLINKPENQDQNINAEVEVNTIILAIEEPELYIHPQMQRLIFSVLKDFSETDQVLYTTHSPSFVDIGNYQTVAVIRKESVSRGTKTHQCSIGILDAETERKTFQFLSSFGLEQNHIFFSKKIILVEGEEDIIAILSTGRKLQLFKEFPEELGYTVTSTGCKSEMLKHMKLLNAFQIPYVILHELDGNPESEENQKIKNLLNGNKCIELPNRLEEAVGHHDHFNKKYDAMKFFLSTDNINDYFEGIVSQLFK